MVHPKAKEVRQEQQKACVDEQRAPVQTQTQKESLRWVEAWRGNLGGIQRNCPSR